MTTVLLIRHGRTTANASGVLAGRTPGVGLDDTGWTQARGLAERLAVVPLTHVVASPLQRTVETAEPLWHGHGLHRVKDERLIECDYGQWSGRTLKSLQAEPLFARVQESPSSVTFPGGESMLQSQARAVAATKDWADRAAQENGAEAIVALISHADIIKSILADAFGLPFDKFQRIVVDPGSLSVLNFHDGSIAVERVNDTGGDVTRLIPQLATDVESEPEDGIHTLGGGGGRRGQDA